MGTARGKRDWLNAGAVLPALGVSLSWICCLPIGAALLGGGFGGFCSYIGAVMSLFSGINDFLSGSRPLQGLPAHKRRLQSGNKLCGGEGFIKEDLSARVGIKETEDPIPICYCFGYTRKMAWKEIAETGKTEIPNKIKAEIQAGNCACEIKNPSGACCLGNVHQIVKEEKGRCIMSNL